MTAAPLLFVTVDTEEDNWGEYTCANPTVDNLRALADFQDLCERYGAQPTYLVNHAVVTSPLGREIIGELRSRGAAFGTHCHPWHTPPVEEVPGDETSYLSRLPAPLVARKLARLTAAVAEAVGTQPRSFRSGRWATGPVVTMALHDLGYQIDASICPGVDWTPEGGMDHSRHPGFAYRFRPAAPFTPDPAGPMVQIPTTTGFWQHNQARALRRYRQAQRLHPRLRAVGFADLFRVANFRWLSPEVSSTRDMIRLARALMANRIGHLDLTFHSPTLVPGLTPFTRTAADRDRFMDRLEQVLDFVLGAGARSAPLEEGLTLVPDPGTPAAPGGE